MALNIWFVNIDDLNRVLRSEMFVSKDGKLRVVHLIFLFSTSVRFFSEVGNAIRVGDLLLNCIDVTAPTFLARDDVVQVVRSHPCAPQRIEIPREETASSWNLPLGRRGRARQNLGSLAS